MSVYFSDEFEACQVDTTSEYDAFTPYLCANSCAACGQPVPSLGACEDAYCSDSCRTLDAPRHHLDTCMSELALPPADALLGKPSLTLSQWMLQNQKLALSHDDDNNDDAESLGKRRRRDAVAADWFAPITTVELLFDVVAPPPLLDSPLSDSSQSICVADFDGTHFDFAPPSDLDFALQPLSTTTAIVPAAVVPAAVAAVPDAADDAALSASRRRRCETVAKKTKRNEYAHLDDAERAKLTALGVTDVDALAVEFEKIVSEVVYLHTRRQRIVVFLADSPLFPLMSWDHADVDEFGQSRILLHTKREHVHAALDILLKSNITEWLFKRFRHATSCEGVWLFKQGAYAQLMQHAEKALGKAHR